MNCPIDLEHPWTNGILQLLFGQWTLGVINRTGATWWNACSLYHNSVMFLVAASSGRTADSPTSASSETYPRHVTSCAGEFRDTLRIFTNDTYWYVPLPSAVAKQDCVDPQETSWNNTVSATGQLALQGNEWRIGSRLGQRSVESCFHD